MKKMFVLVLAALFTLVLGSAAMASTMGVNVSPGFAIDIEHDFIATDGNDDTAFRLNWGVNENLYLKFTYTGFQDPFLDGIKAFGMRYELLNNFAFVANYKTQEVVDVDLDTIDNTKYNLGFRGKLDLGKTADLVGELTWNHGYYKNLDLVGDTDNSINWELYTQLEFKIGEVGALNFGADVVRTGNETDTTWLAGAEFYSGKSTIYFDYYMYDNSDFNDLCLGVEIGF